MWLPLQDDQDHVLQAPMPGVVKSISCSSGDEVGQACTSISGSCCLCGSLFSLEVSVIAFFVFCACVLVGVSAPQPRSRLARRWWSWKQ